MVVRGCQKSWLEIGVNRRTSQSGNQVRVLSEPENYHRGMGMRSEKLKQ